MNEQHLLLHLTLIDGIGPSTIQKIIINKPDQIGWLDLYTYSVIDFIHIGIFQKQAQKIVEGLKDVTSLEKELHLIEKNNVQWTTFLDETYPSLLKHIHLPPPVLYWFGDLEQVSDCIAIVGSRKANQYGEQIIHDLVPQLVAHQFTIVSGGAIGADSFAHRSTVRSGGKTIVVLGSGLLNQYPYSNRRLFADIIENNGALISSFPLRTPPHPGNFPARNRIIAGLSRGCVVVQAAQKSGACITAQFALEQGRDVFAVPGSIDDPLSAGCHNLIQQGAKLIACAQDILVEYGFEKKTEEDKPAKEKTNFFPANSIEQHIINACTIAQSTDDLAISTNKTLSELQAFLFDLQLEGYIQQDFTGMWKSLR